ncbi:hypothetical protein GLOIN_2v1544654 [Rhizophagus clarus]|uniref:F-box domain-containing protein n=1 Tax=Rhizophagus clarus TaxID=94130 RepID=A0A8H3QB45_9GLOM|nr:hypothetical protein GLOIN_2v1544654 [Rhizophagus clarus]
MNKILTEILQQIFKELLKDSAKDGYSALMVNREWCNTMIPMLWENPFATGHRYNHYKIVRTLLSTLDNYSRTSLIDNGIDLSSSKSGTIFDYAFFIRNIPYDYIYKGIKDYVSSEYESETFNIIIDNNYDIKIKNIRLIFHQLLSSIINKSEFIKTIRRFHYGPHTKELDIIEDEINMIPYLPGANKSLKELYGIHISNKLNFTKFQTGLSQICKNITLVKINCETMDSSRSLASLIRSQKKLVILIIEFSEDDIFVPILESLENHKESLEYLSLKNCNFNIISEKALETLKSCKKLEILGLNHCTGLDNMKLLSLSTSFPLLRKFTFNYKKYYPLENFLIGIIKTANTNLRKITLDSFTLKITEAILKYATNFTSCELGQSEFSSAERNIITWSENLTGVKVLLIIIKLFTGAVICRHFLINFMIKFGREYCRK